MKVVKENGVQKMANIGQLSTARQLEWWEATPPGERKLICGVMQMLRGAKQSQLRDVAKAAAKWESGIGCFIKVRLMNASQNSKGKQGGICITVEAVNPQKNK